MTTFDLIAAMIDWTNPPQACWQPVEGDWLVC